MTTTHTRAPAQPPNGVSGTPITDMSAASRGAPSPETEPAPAIVGPIRRRRLDLVLVAVGAVVAIVLAVAGGLLLWGHNFADDYVGRELSSQNVSFPDAAALQEEGRSDLLGYAGEQVTTGDEAEAYASYIGGHLEGVADGATFADLGGPEREAKAAVQAAIDEGAPPATVDELQATADGISNQRNTLFKGETLRGLLLSTYAWSTIGSIAGIAAIVAYAATAVMAVLVVLGLVHRHRTA